MKDCDKCRMKRLCAELARLGYTEACNGHASLPFTNRDKLRAMSDEDLAKKMSGLESFALTCGRGWPPEKWLEWLRQEAEG